MGTLQESTAGLRAEMETRQSRLAMAEKGILEVQSQKDDALVAIQLVHSRVEKANSEIAALQQRLLAVASEKEESQARFNEIQSLLVGSFEKEEKVLRQRLVTLDNEEKGLQRELKEKIQRLEEHRAAAMQKKEQCRGSENQIVQRVMQASKPDGPLSHAGILGRLGDLATVEKEYDVAVSTACAGTLDYLVVETTEGAQQCIQFLKESNVGRATFIILSQLTDLETKLENISKPSSPVPPLPRLFNLLKPIPGLEKKLRPALYMATRDTLVASDLETAVRTAYVGDKAQWRVVTLGGDLIDTSGSMSGGGKDVRTGAMKIRGCESTVTLACKSTSSEQDISKSEEIISEELETVVQKLQSQLHSIRLARSEAEQRHEQVQREMQKLSQEKTKIQMALKKLTDQDIELASRMKTLQSENSLTNDEEKQIEKLTDSIGKLDEQLQSLSERNEVKALRAEVATLQRQLKAVGGPALSKAQSKVDSFSHQVIVITPICSFLYQIISLFEF